MSQPNPRTLYKLKSAADWLKAAAAETPHSASGLRLWADQGRINCVRLNDGERVIPGSELLRLTQHGTTP